MSVEIAEMGINVPFTVFYLSRDQSKISITFLENILFEIQFFFNIVTLKNKKKNFFLQKCYTGKQKKNLNSNLFIFFSQVFLFFKNCDPNMAPRTCTFFNFHRALILDMV